MKLDFSEKVESNYPERLPYGIHDVVITGLVYQTPEGKNPYIELGFANDFGEHKEILSVSDKAFVYSMDKLEKLGLAAGITRAEIEKCTEVAQLSKLVIGKKVRVKLQGEEKQGQNGAYVRAKIGFGKWVVPAGSAGLTFKENPRGEKGDIKWLEGVNAGVASSKPESDLPF